MCNGMAMGMPAEVVFRQDEKTAQGHPKRVAVCGLLGQSCWRSLSAHQRTEGNGHSICDSRARIDCIETQLRALRLSNSNETTANRPRHLCQGRAVKHGIVRPRLGALKDALPGAFSET